MNREQRRAVAKEQNNKPVTHAELERILAILSQGFDESFQKVAVSVNNIAINTLAIKAILINKGVCTEEEFQAEIDKLIEEREEAMKQQAKETAEAKSDAEALKKELETAQGEPTAEEATAEDN